MVTVMCSGHRVRGPENLSDVYVTYVIGQPGADPTNLRVPTLLTC